MKDTEEYVINKMNFKKDIDKEIWYDGKIKQEIIKYLPVKQKITLNFEKYINNVLFNKFD